MYPRKLTKSQYNAICGFINGLYKLNIEPRNRYDLSSFDESSYERTTTSFDYAIYLFDHLKQYMNYVYDSRTSRKYY